MGDVDPGEIEPNWPHQFTKSGNGWYICVHCHKEYPETDPGRRPPDPCPARNTKRELKRIGV